MRGSTCRLAAAPREANEPEPRPGDGGSTKKPGEAPAATQLKEEPVDPFTYVFGRPGELRRDLALLNSSPEKLLLVGLLSLAIGLASNLWGQTEFLFRVLPATGELAHELRLDALYAVDGLKAYYDEEYEVQFPGDWLFDQRVALIKARQSGPDDILGSSPRKRRPGSAPDGVTPDAAWGPAGGGQRLAKERENLSVVKQRLPPRPSGEPQQIADILGEPRASLEKLLRESIAPAGSKKTAEALEATRSERGGITYYQYQWRTTFESGFMLRTYSSAALGPPDSQGNRNLITLTAVLPESRAGEGSGAAALMPRVLEGFRVNPG